MTCVSCTRSAPSIAAAAARLAATRRTTGQLTEIEAQHRRIDAASAEPLAKRLADLDFHAAVVDAAHNSLLAHAGAMVRVALEAAASPVPTPADDSSFAFRAAVIDTIRVGDPDGAEKAMRMLVELAWEAIARNEEAR